MSALCTSMKDYVALNMQSGTTSVTASPPASCLVQPAGWTFQVDVTSCDGEIVNNVCMPCSNGQVLNLHTGRCQAPCPTEQQPQSPYHNALNIGISFGTFCQNNCAVNATLWVSEDDNGFDIEQFTFNHTGAMCGTSDQLPTPRPAKCDSPRVVRVDGTCGNPDPTCPSWQKLENHACVDKPCEAGKTLKCGTVNDAQQCACAGPTDCEPGTVKDAFGNCVSQQSCPSGQVQDSVTGVCGPPKDDQKDCPEGTHREGMTCVKNPGDCQVGTWYIPGCGCVSDVNQCMQRSSDDIDGDGIPNKDDNDADNDGLPNSMDSDADNDGLPNSLDSTPQGSGSAPLADPSKTRDTSKSDPDGDLDGDGIPNSTDPDRDGDGLPNGDDGTPDGREDGTGVDEGQCDPATQECEGEKDKPGKPAELGDQFYKKKEGRSFQQVWSNFISRVQQARIVTAGSRFFTVSIGGGSCPHWVIPSTFVSPAIPIDMQCSSEVTAALRIAGYIVLIIAAWVAFKIALL